ncbi:hypothetical protein PGT21_016302 [Puccinia graminis f. sp. tritici]|uniref:Uncharacterized protein n=1 Tax=Puccinia graminis f. sp. tritici TaxID=56615 RepID=A0A5B0LMK4_PUCGR|nr:hypothetical protein PGT21_016302 [Puccinia graminis f. sp. tritici]
MVHRSQIPFLFIALGALGCNQIRLSSGMVEGVSQHGAEYCVTPHPLVDLESTNPAEIMEAPVSERFGRDWLSEIETEKSHVMQVASKDTAIDESKTKEINQRIKSLKLHTQENWKDVTNHLEQLHDYLKMPIVKTASPASRMPQSLVEPLFENPSRQSKKFLQFGRSQANPNTKMAELKNILTSQVVPIWKYLQAEFINCKCKEEDNPEIKLKYLGSLFLLGDYIHTHKLLSKNEIKEIELYRPETVINLVKFHVNLLIISKGKKTLWKS